MEPIRTRASEPWQEPGTARPLLAWSGKQREALAAALGRAWAEWRAAWGIAADATPVVCEDANAADVLRDDWQALGAAAWLQVPHDAAGQLHELLFGVADGNSPVAGTVVADCMRDARLRLARAVHLGDAQPAPSSPPPGLGQAWSGALRAVLPGMPGWSLLLGPEAMQAWCGQAGLRSQDTNAHAAREPLCTAAEALGTRPLSLQVELSGCEIALGQLQGLRIGDVVRLPHALDAPARLADAQGRTVFEAFLVASQGRKAIELAKPPTR